MPIVIPDPFPDDPDEYDYFSRKLPERIYISKAFESMVSFDPPEYNGFRGDRDADYQCQDGVNFASRLQALGRRLTLPSRRWRQKTAIKTGNYNTHGATCFILL